MTPYLTFPNGNFRGEILFMIMYRMHTGLGIPGRGNHIWKPVYKSEVKPNIGGRNGPTKFEFNQFSLLVSDLCAGDKDKEIKIEFFKSQKSGKHINIGQSLYTVQELEENQAIELAVTKQEGATLKFSKLSFKQRNSFLNYIFGGCELNLAVAIDFTLSNGNPKKRDSLHNLNLNNNEYYKALKSVGDILQFYDTDK